MGGASQSKGPAAAAAPATRSALPEGDFPSLPLCTSAGPGGNDNAKWAAAGAAPGAGAKRPDPAATAAAATNSSGSGGKAAPKKLKNELQSLCMIKK